MTILLIIAILFAPAAYAQFSNIIFQHEAQGHSDYHYLLPLGDQNNDGFDDIGVIKTGDRNSEPGVRIFFGRSSMHRNPDVVILADPDSVAQIYYGDTIGDLNGDGYIDWYLWLVRDLPVSENVITFYAGGPYLNYEPLLTIRRFHPGKAGDFNGDGYDDFYISDGDENTLDIYFGGATLDTIPDWHYTPPAGFDGQDYPEGMGDLNGDGYSDIITDSFQLMNAAFFFGGATPDTVPSLEWVNFEARLSEIVSDITGDGVDDLIVPYDGALDVHPGGPDMSRIAANQLNPIYFPYSTTSFTTFNADGDFNGDGVGDLITSKYGNQRFEIFLGGRWMGSGPVQVVDVGYGSTYRYCKSAGDVNNDGVDDIVILKDDRYVIVYSGNPDIPTPSCEETMPITASLALCAYPNPFNPQSTISLGLDKQSLVTVELFDIAGRKVETLHSGMLTPGTKFFTVDGNGLASGSYFVVAKTQKSQISKRITLVR